MRMGWKRLCRRVRRGVGQQRLSALLRWWDHRIVAALLVLAMAARGGALMAGGAEMTDQQVLETLAREQPRDRAIRLGLAYLRAQQREDGRMGDRFPVASAGLALMAHLAAGITFDDPRHGQWLRRTLGYVLNQQRADGYFGQKDGSRMYGHGIVTLMLAEALGMIRDEEQEERARTALTRAVELTVRAARVGKAPNQAGGWRYEPTSADSDLSLSGWQMMSLHAAQQVGIEVPAEVIERAYEYARRNTSPDGKVGYQGQGQEHSPSLRGLGMLAFAIAGRGEDPLVTAIGERISREPARWEGATLFYRVYYDAVGLSRARPDLWAQYSPALVDLLVKNQLEDGSWGAPPGNTETQHGAAYVVSMAILALAVDRHVLPAYQR